MKRSIPLIMLLLPVLVAIGYVLYLLTGCYSQAETAAQNNISLCEGSAMGYRGIIRVELGVSNGTIWEINVIESHEDKAVGGAAIDELIDLVLQYNTAELDAISGATETSKGFLAAVENAIIKP